SKLNQTEINFIKSDLFENIEEKAFDIIVSNPPYIKTEVIKTLSKQVRQEPMLALDGGEYGLDIYRRIIETAYKHIKNNGYLCLEIGYDQKEEVTNLLKQYKNYTEITTIKDLSNNDRCIVTKITL
ncbi:MAG: HemK/PrmC family methyltransferase, partial [Clostridia bacterium]